MLSTAKASVDAGCDASILSDVATGDIDNPNTVSCEITASGTSDNVYRDAVAEAVAEAKAYACEGQAAAAIELSAVVRPRVGRHAEMLHP